MLQFIIGLSTFNVSWLIAGFLGGVRVYYSPPLFFFAIAGIRRLRHVSRPLLTILGFVALIEALSAVLHGLDIWRARQSLAFIVACVCWIYVFQYASKRDIFTFKRTVWLLAVYALYLLLASLENLVNEDPVAYAVSCVFSWECGASTPYSDGGRMAYFSTEASAAAIAVSASIMPFICANLIVKRSASALALFVLGLIVLYSAEGLTSWGFCGFSILFVLLPRVAVLGIPAFMIGIIVFTASVSAVLEEKGALVALVQAWFGGYSQRIDMGIETASYTSRFMTYLIGARAFLSSPLIGLGIGGTQSFFYELYNSGLYLDMGEEQNEILDHSTSAYNSPMVVRMPGEIGIIGTGFLIYHGYRALRLALRPRPGSMLDYAFLYSCGAMLLSFCFAGELLNPCIAAFIALLAQVLRSRAAAPAVSAVTAPSGAPSMAPS